MKRKCPQSATYSRQIQFRLNCEASILQHVKRAKNAASFIKIQLHN
jgi:hypothetical protein